MSSTLHYILIILVMVLSLHSMSHAIVINTQDLERMRNMAKAMDSTADPCNDFHQYACGSGVETIDNVFYASVKCFKETLRVLKEHYPITRKEKQHYTEKIQIYVETGTNSENAAVLPFLDEVKPNPIQEWPLLEEMQAYARQGENYDLRSWTADDVDVLGTLAHLFSYGLNDVLISHKLLSVEGKATIVVRAPNPTPAPANEVLMLLLSTKLPRATVARYLVEFVDTHQQLQTIYNAFADATQFANCNYTYMAEQLGNFRHLAKFLKDMLPHPAKIEEQTIAFHAPYFMFLLPKKWQPDEARKYCNYFMFQFLIHLQESVIPAYNLVSTTSKLALAMNYAYYKHFYLPHEKELDEGFDSTVKTLHKNIIQTVAENRLNLTAQQLLEITTKFNNLNINIGNLPKNVTESMVEEYYDAILPDLDPENFYKNELLVRKLAHLETILCPKDMICQNLSPHAFYAPNRNMIVFPFSALLSPMYDVEWHPVFAMSQLGFAAGHELMHAIDSSGLNEAIFTPSFQGDSLQVPSINAAVKCLNHQYPTDNIDERLADVIGAQLAFSTYSREYGLQPGFTRTTWQQLFFMSLAQMFCGVGSEIDREHDTVKMRLQEIVMNSKEFAEAFQCPAGSKMNPVTKCSYI